MNRQEVVTKLKEYIARWRRPTFDMVTGVRLRQGLRSATGELINALADCHRFEVKMTTWQAIEDGAEMCLLPEYETHYSHTFPNVQFSSSDWVAPTACAVNPELLDARAHAVDPTYPKGDFCQLLPIEIAPHDGEHELAEMVAKTNHVPYCLYHYTPMDVPNPKRSSCPLGLDCPANGDCASCYGHATAVPTPVRPPSLPPASMVDSRRLRLQREAEAWRYARSSWQLATSGHYRDY